MCRVGLVWALGLFGGCGFLLGTNDEDEDEPDAAPAAIDAMTVGTCLEDPDPDGFCGSGVCDRRTNTCISDSEVTYVTTSGDDANTCIESRPCASIDRGLAVAADTNRRVVFVAPGTYEQPVDFASPGSAEAVRIIGFGAVVAPPDVVDGDIVFDISPGGGLLIDGLAITGPEAGPAGITGIGLKVRGDADLFRVTVSGFSVGVSVEDGSGSARRLVMDASRAVDNLSGVVVVESTFVMRSALITGSDVGLALIDATVDELSLSTIVGNESADIRCSTGQLALTARGLIVDELADPTATCAGIISFEESYATGQVGGGNLMTRPVFVDEQGGDFRLVAGSPGIDHVSADVDGFDVNGTPRVVGSAANVGAHEEVVDP